MSWSPRRSASKTSNDLPRKSISSPAGFGFDSDGILPDRTPSQRRRSIMNPEAPFGSGCIIAGTYSVPTRVLRELFMKLDKRDSPQKPGQASFASIETAMVRFHNIFGEEPGGRAMPQYMEQVLDELKSQIRAHSTGFHVPMVYWDQDAIFRCFRVHLSIKERIYFTFDISENSTCVAQSITCIMYLAVIVSILTYVLGTVPSNSEAFDHVLASIDIVCVMIFTVDYLIRLANVPFARIELLDKVFLLDLLSGEKDLKLPTCSRRLLRFLVAPMGLVDFLSVVPFWTELSIEGPQAMFNDDSGQDLFKLLRLARVIRILKLGNAVAKSDLGEDQNIVMHLFQDVVVKAKPALQLVSLLIAVALLVFGSFIWYAERGVYFKRGDPRCPVVSLCAESAIRIRQLADGSWEHKASPFQSIPSAFWWVITTISTVGYGDAYPITTVGYLIGGATILYGIVVLTLPVGIIGTAFAQAYNQVIEDQARRKSAENSAENVPNEPVIRRKRKQKKRGADASKAIPDFKLALQKACISLGLPRYLFKGWEAELAVVTRFQDLPSEHPCDALARWGTPVFNTLTAYSKHAESQPTKNYVSAARSSWYSLQLFAADAYSGLEFPGPFDRTLFEAAFELVEGP